MATVVAHGSAAEFKVLCIVCGYDREQVAELLELEGRTVRTFEKPNTRVPLPVIEALRKRARTVTDLAELMAAQRPSALPLFRDSDRECGHMELTGDNVLWNSAVARLVGGSPKIAVVHFNEPDYSDFLASRHLPPTLPNLIAWAADLAGRRGIVGQ